LRGSGVFFRNGYSLSEHWRKQKETGKYNAFRILIDMPVPNYITRINERMEKKLAEGLLQEIENLFAMGLYRSLTRTPMPWL
jgi:tRNA A37 N6-isopentenylltransferase MiaA